MTKMEYKMPNLGQFGYVEPKKGFNWTAFLIVISALFFGFAWYFSKLKKDDAKKKDDTLPKLA